MQGPLSTIRWTFDNASCPVALHWLEPPLSQQRPARGACPRRHALAAPTAWDVTSRGHVFSVLAGYVADGQDQLQITPAGAVIARLVTPAGTPPATAASCRH